MICDILNMNILITNYIAIITAYGMFVYFYTFCVFFSFLSTYPAIRFRIPFMHGLHIIFVH